MLQLQANAKFSIEPLSEESQKEMIEKNVWSEKCPVHLDRLKAVHFSYYDFNEELHQDGQIVVLDAVAPRVLNIFKQLYEMKFPIAKAKPMEFYGGNDVLSMADNNTVCFNNRDITGGGSISIHSYGLALDINPIQNPYIAFGKQESPLTCAAEIQPYEGSTYINRTNLRPGMVESAVSIFKDNGFMVWGGQWNTPIDWQHFQTPRSLAQLLAVMQSQDAEQLFEFYIQHSQLLNTLPATNRKLEAFYMRAPECFVEMLQKNSTLFDQKFADVEELLEKEIA